MDDPFRVVNRDGQIDLDGLQRLAQFTQDSAAFFPVFGAVFQVAFGTLYAPPTAAAPASALAVKDLKSGQLFFPVFELDFDSTPTAYDPTKGDWVFTYNASTQVLKIRLNGYTGTVNGETFSNGLLKTLGVPGITNFPPNGHVNVAYSFTFTASGGIQPYTWSETGTLPPGLSLNSFTGVLSGTPTTAGTYIVIFKVTDAGGSVSTVSVSIVINP